MFRENNFNIWELRNYIFLAPQSGHKQANCSISSNVQIIHTNEVEECKRSYDVILQWGRLEVPYKTYVRLPVPVYLFSYTDYQEENSWEDPIGIVLGRVQVVW